MKKATVLATGALALFITGCKNSQFDGFTKTESGLHYKFFNHDESGAKSQLGDDVYMRFIISKQSNDSVIVDSKNASRDGSGFAHLSFKKSSFTGSFEEGLLMMAKGDSAAFIASADSFFLKTNGMNELPKGFKPGEYLKAVFKVKDITPAAQVEAERKKQMEEREAMMKEMAEKEKPSMDKFLADNKITVKPTASGLYYVETKKGTGANPKATDMVTVHYTGKLLDGTVFDSSVERNEPATFSLGQVIPGWVEGIQLMRKGGKAKLVIPSSIGYGPSGNRGIPPYAPLYFEVELIDIKSAPEQPAPMPGK